jgi:phosphopantothenoylcysteine synthetase/decarboxylase
MNILVTAGNTLVPVDRVRCLTNIFTGRTGAGIALYCHARGHHVTVLTSHPEAIKELASASPNEGRWHLHRYKTFDDLEHHMKAAVERGGLDAIIHSAAVSDYRAAGIYAPVPGTHFQAANSTWTTDSAAPPALADRSADKVKSDEPELWLRLIRTPKLVDQVRGRWGFRGLLVKFKLEVGIGEEQLLEIAERSRRHSEADLMVANTLEGKANWALLGPLGGVYQRVGRRELPPRLLAAIEQVHQERAHG